MSVLAIDMLTPTTRLGLDQHYREFEPSRDQAELLPGQIQSFLFDQDISFADLKGILVITGPGSFTGIRVALSSMHAMGFALDIPVIGIRADEAFALMLDKKKSACLILDTRRKDFAVAFKLANQSSFEDFEELTSEDIATRLDNGMILCGNGVIKAGLDASFVDIDLSLLIARKPIKSKGYEPDQAQTFYLRPPDVTLSPQKFEHETLYKQK